MELFIKCPVCDGDGDVIVDLECGCCQIFQDCDRCDGEGYVPYEPKE